MLLMYRVCTLTLSSCWAGSCIAPATGRTSLHHVVEAARIASAIAAEIGADVNVARTATLLHDIGKAVDHEVEGPHALIGAELAKRLGRSAKIVHAIAAHHNEEEPETVEAWIVQAADALSGDGRGRVETAWNTTSSGWKHWRLSPTLSRELRRASRYRPDVRCVCSSNPSR